VTEQPLLSESTLIGSEREQLEAFLDDNRSELAATLDGPTEEQARRSLVPSLTTVLSLVKHAAWVERVWFQVSLLGRTRAELGMPEDGEDSFLLAADDLVRVLPASRGSVVRRRAGRRPGPVRRLVPADPGHRRGGWRQSVRNAMLRLAPPKILVRAGTQVVDWTAP
jgi:hypothetical protein